MTERKEREGERGRKRNVANSCTWSLGDFIIDNMAEFFKVLVNTDDALTTDLESIVSHNLFESFCSPFLPNSSSVHGVLSSRIELHSLRS